jgi:hypothetical protein
MVAALSTEVATTLNPPVKPMLDGEPVVRQILGTLS